MLRVGPTDLEVGFLPHAPEPARPPREVLILRPSPHYDEYLEQPKTYLEPGNEEYLVGLARQMEDSNYPLAHAAAASALTESALIGVSKPPSWRLGVLELAEIFRDTASSRARELESLGHPEMTNLDFHDRLDVASAFTPLYEALVNGVNNKKTIRAASRAQSRLEEIAKEAATFSRSEDEEISKTYLGLVSELIIPLAINNRFIASGSSKSPFCLPALERSDNGWYNLPDRHDFQVVHFNRGRYTVSPIEQIEAKTCSTYKDSYYESPVVHARRVAQNAIGIDSPETLVWALADGSVEERREYAARTLRAICNLDKTRRIERALSRK